MPHEYIYGLRDPRNSEIRYVGYTSYLPKQRLRTHIYGARRGKRTPRDCWIRKLLALGIEPEPITLEVDPVGGWQEAEKAWIATLRNMGCRLTNVSSGGRGGVRGLTWKLSEETKERMRKPKSAETRARMSASRRANPRSPISEETRAKMRVARLGKPLSEETRAKIGRSGPEHGMYGRTHSPEARAKISAARKRKGATWKGGKHSPETLERLREIAQSRSPEHYRKIADANRGKALDPAMKTRISETMRKRHAEKREAGLAWVRDPETARKKMSAAQRGKKQPPRSPEHRRKLSTALQGHAVGPETREKIAFSAHVRWHVNRGIVKDNCRFCSP